jgi:cytochrome c
MDSWEWNKIAGAVLGAVLFVLVVKLVADKIYDSPAPAKPSYSAPIPEEATSQAAAAPVAEPVPDFGSALASADVGHGKEISARCEMCHDLSKGGANKIGPALWGLVGRPRASQSGYTYSGALSANHDSWGFEALYAFLRAPQAAVPGTKMSFAGLRASQDRVDLIAYLRMQSDHPLPIPPKQ